MTVPKAKGKFYFGGLMALQRGLVTGGDSGVNYSAGDGAEGEMSLAQTKVPECHAAPSPVSKRFL